MLHTAFVLVTALYFYLCAFHFLLFSSVQEKDSLPLPNLEGDDRAKARALAVIHSHPVVSLHFCIICYFICYMTALSNIIFRRIQGTLPELMACFCCLVDG